MKNVKLEIIILSICVTIRKGKNGVDKIPVKKMSSKDNFCMNQNLASTAKILFRLIKGIIPKFSKRKRRKKIS